MAVIKNGLSTTLARSAWAILLSLVLVSCIAAVPLIIDAIEEEGKSTAAITVDEDAETVYAEAVKTIKARGVTTITKEDPDNFTVEGVRKGRNASMKVEAVEPGKSRLIFTIEDDDEDESNLDEVITAVQEFCADLGLKCRTE